MAHLTETSSWEPGIYQIEQTDPVQGGPDGISNIQGKQLASRTLYLKNEIERVDGDVTTLSGAVTILEGQLETIAENDAVSFASALDIYWNHLETIPRFELFSGVFQQHNTIEVDILKVVQGDDSIDVSSTADLVVDNDYVLNYPDGTNEVVRVKEILPPTEADPNPHRFLAYEPVNRTFYDGTLGGLTGTKSFKNAVFGHNGVYITKNYANTGVAHVYLIFKKSDIGAVTVSVKDDNLYPGTMWEQVTGQSARYGSEILSTSEVVDSGDNEIVIYKVPVNGVYAFRLDFDMAEEDSLGETCTLTYVYLKNAPTFDNLTITQTDYNSSVRNSTIATEPPSDTDGMDGDVWYHV